MRSLTHPLRTAINAALLALSLTAVGSAFAAHPGALEVVAELPFRPGNAAPAAHNRLFATVHPLGATPAQLIEITGPHSYKPWPSAALQKGTAAANDAQIDTPLGIAVDDHNRLWIADMGLNLGKTRIWGFDIASGRELYRIELGQDIAPKGSFLQDLVVDSKAGWIYLADIANPGLIAVEISSGKARRFGGHPALQAEPEARLMIAGAPIPFNGKPNGVGVDPIGLSADGATLFFGAMNGRTWYSVPTELLRGNASDPQIGAAIKRVGAKPVSDGALTDSDGRHFFTNVNEGGIDVLGTDGTLRPLVRDARLDWPDSVQQSPNGWLYIAANQAYKAPGFSGAKEDTGKPPYRILRVWPGK